MAMAQQLPTGTNLAPSRYSEQRRPQFTGGGIDPNSGNIIPSSPSEAATGTYKPKPLPGADAGAGLPPPPTPAPAPQAAPPPPAQPVTQLGDMNPPPAAPAPVTVDDGSGSDLFGNSNSFTFSPGPAYQAYAAAEAKQPGSGAAAYLAALKSSSGFGGVLGAGGGMF